MLVDKVLEDGGFRQADGGFTLRIRLPWYRSLPLSTVEITSLSIDERQIAAENIQLSLESGQWNLSDLPALTDRYWFVLDSAELRVKAAPLASDMKHDVTIQVSLYPPYVRGLTRIFRCSKTMTLG